MVLNESYNVVMARRPTAPGR
ncbi:MAG: hypothetical protein R2789_07970 [Microthrixaceae bacterium]